MGATRLLAILLLPTLLGAQSYTATLRGVVTDPSQAVIPGVAVAATDVERGVKHTATTDDAGRYVLNALPPGRYTLSLQAAGFKPKALGPFELQVQQQATLDAQLEVGEVATQVEVQGAATLLNTSNAALGQVIDNNYVLSLPLSGRAAMDLVMLTPGVTPVNINTAGWTLNFVGNGTRNSTSDTLLDGMSTANIEQNGGINENKYQATVDAIQEFKVQSNLFSAEFGNTGGVIVNMVSKSGTNQLHGSVFEFYRNNTLNANSWFSNRVGQKLADSSRNIFGGSAGGPFHIPGVYNGRNRTFFFGTFEARRTNAAATSLITVPTLAQRDGDFSDTRLANGQLMVVYNPFDTYAADGGRTLRRPFAGNIVPKSMHSPVALKVLPYLPKPNLEGNPYTRVNNFFAQGTNHNPGQQVDFKIDHHFTEKTRLTSRYSTQWGTFTPVVLDYSAETIGSIRPGQTDSHTQNFVLDITRTHGPATLITARYGLLRVGYARDPATRGFDSTTLGLPKELQINGFLMFPTFSFEGYGGLGPSSSTLIRRGEDVNSFTGSVTRIVSGHNLKIGGEARLMRLNYVQPAAPAGSFSFNRAVTNEDPNRSSTSQGNGAASFLLGWGSGGSITIDPRAATAAQYFGWYVQDEWKLSRKLSVSLGLRYDLEIPRTERFDRQSWFDPDAPSPIAGLVPEFPNLKGVFHFADKDNRRVYWGDYTNVQPRIGIAYALDAKTSIRTGYGMYYTMSTATIKGQTSQGFSAGTSVQFSRDAGLTRYATLENPFPNGLRMPPGRADGPRTNLGLQISTITDRQVRNPQYHSWNFSIQRVLVRNSMLEVTYAGSRGVHLYFGGGLENVNRLDPSYWSMGRPALNRTVRNPFFGVITERTSRLSDRTITQETLLRPYPQYTGGVGGSTPNIGNSIYHSMQVRFERRLTNGLAVLANYTFAKLIDDSSYSHPGVGFLGGRATIQDPRNLRAERSLSLMDINHRSVATFTYKLPVGHGRAWLRKTNRFLDAAIGGWDVSGILTLSAGFPIVPGLQGAILWDGGQRANLIGDPATHGPIEERLRNYLNPAAFSRPEPDTFGNAPRTLNYRSPARRNIDMALMKNFRLRESKNIQLRLETFNTTNSVSFGAPSAAFGAQEFGAINGYAPGAGARQVQIAVKFYF